MKDKWSDITIDNYIELCNVTSEGYNKTLDIVSILLDKDIEEIRDMDMRILKEYSDISKFVGTQPDTYVNDTFILNGVEYGRIPDINLLKGGEYADAMAWQDKPADNLHNYSALLYRPIVTKTDKGYTIEPHRAEGFSARAELFRRELSITKVWGFFYYYSLFAMNYSESLLASLETEKTKTKTKVKKTLRTKATQQVTKKRN